MEKIKATIQKVDFELSRLIYRKVPKTKRMRTILMSLEWSCHGIPWLVGTLILIYLYPNNRQTYNLMTGLVLDVLFVAVIKALCRRRRPTFSYQDDQMVISVDKYSMPSGHTSRAIYLALFFNQRAYFSILVWLWASFVLTSRILLGRHHVGDVIAGVLLGYVEYSFQFGFGRYINHVVTYLIMSALGLQFSNTNDMSDDSY